MQAKEDFYKLGVQLAIDELIKEGANLAKYVKPEVLEGSKGLRGFMGSMEDKMRRIAMKDPHGLGSGSELGIRMNAMPGGPMSQAGAKFKELLEEARAKGLNIDPAEIAKYRDDARMHETLRGFTKALNSPRPAPPAPPARPLEDPYQILA